MTFFDCHCHTERSACAEDVSLAMYAEIARTSDRVFAVTDHSAQLFYGPEHPWGFWQDDAEEKFAACYDEGMARCEDYVEWVRSAQTGGMLVGTELDVFYDGTLVFDPELLGELDFVIGAVHGARALKQELPLADVIDEFKTRTLHLCEAGVDALAHPFREWKQKERPVPLDLIDWLVTTAADAETSIELNCHYKVPEWDLPMLQRCVEVGVPIAIGTDTHRKREFGEFSYHEELLAQAGIAEADWGTALLGAPQVQKIPSS